MRIARFGFTLIELLVVISIIVVLLALLVPSMDKAIYQAELATCGSQLAGMGRGAATYAAGSKRAYPYRPAVRHAVDTQRQPHDLVAGVSATGPIENDDRPIIKSMFSLKTMVDPLNEPVDFEAVPEVPVPEIVMASYAVWWGWAYSGHRGMFKLGDRMTWSGLSNVPGESRTARFDLLASDRHHLKRGSEVQASHPDKAGTLTALKLQNTTDNPWVPAFQVTYSFWRLAGSDAHGELDMNYLHENGSVSRMNDVLPYDVRTFPVPERHGNINPDQNLHFIPESGR